MNDYKELIEHPELSWDYIDRLRCAIEQLARDNNVLARERDAAVTWVPHQCGTCKHHHVRGLGPIECDKNGCANFFKPENWEWRGVQE